MPSLWPWLLVSALSAASGAVITWRTSHDNAAAALQACQLQAQQAQTSAATQARTRIEAALRASDAATMAQAATQTRLQSQLAKAKNELNTLTTGRACLDGATVRLLNTQPGMAGADLPTPTPEPDTATAATATDTDLAGWAATAASQYQACRERLTAIAQWDESVNGDAGHGR